jgi:basic amino acid/polyamine antiporter, APA family
VFILGNAADRPARWLAGGKTIAALAFVYSVYAVGGAGAETVYWGFLLILCGLPVYVLMARSRIPSVLPTAGSI